MAPGSSHNLSREERHLLLKTARRSILHGLEEGAALPVDPGRYPAPLREKRASFVTLHEGGALRGCIGTLEPIRPLIEDVAANAWAAAFADPRFAPLAKQEFDLLQIEISVLGPPQPVRFTSEEDLIRRLRPGRDGLILQEGSRRGTFLPSVWDSLPEPGRFLQHLKVKAGLPADYWSDTLKIYRYTTESFAERRE